MSNIENLPSLEKARKRNQNIEPETIKFFIEENEKNKYKKKYLIKTYGCQANEADSEFIKYILEELGMHETTTEENADFILLNTCAIRHTAENKIFGELGRLKKYKRTNPNLKIAISGCMPQEPIVIEKIKNQYPQVDLIFGTHNIYMLPQYVKALFKENKKVREVFSIQGNNIENIKKKRFHKHKAFVSIMDGCDEFCTYCIVPYTRGKERSRKPKYIIKEVKELINEGYLEITLIGQNVGSYGLDFKDIKYSVANLLEDLAKLDIKRIRFMTSYPRDITDDTINVMAKYKNIMPHIHLPMQSGSDLVLKKMNRHYTVSKYLEIVKKLRNKIPQIAITTDTIVAFPYETKKDFKKTLNIYKKIKFDGSFSFIYSKREGTPAARMENKTTKEDKTKRLNKLNEVVNKILTKKNKVYKNEVLEVLVDGISSNNVMHGYSPENKIVSIENGDTRYVGKIVKVLIYKTRTFTLYGKMI